VTDEHEPAVDAAGCFDAVFQAQQELVKRSAADLVARVLAVPESDEAHSLDGDRIAAPADVDAPDSIVRPPAGDQPQRVVELMHVLVVRAGVVMPSVYENDDVGPAPGGFFTRHGDRSFGLRAIGEVTLLVDLDESEFVGSRRLVPQQRGGGAVAGGAIFAGIRVTVIRHPVGIDRRTGAKHERQQYGEYSFHAASPLGDFLSATGIAGNRLCDRGTSPQRASHRAAAQDRTRPRFMVFLPRNE
jgi:hypothetical protein